jgi:two-component system sensor histidine kinase UhpB
MARPPKDSGRHFGLSWRGLTLQLFVIIILPLTALLLVITFGSLSAHQTAMRNLVGERDERAVRTAANAIESEINHRIAAIRGLALRASSTSPTDLSGVISTSNYLLSFFDQGIALFGRDGSLKASQGDQVLWEYQASGKDLAFTGFLTQNNTPVLGVITNPANGQQLIFLAAKAPQGNLVAIGALSTEMLIGGTLADSFPGGGNATVYVIDPSFRVLYQSGALDRSGLSRDHPGLAEAFAGQSGATYVKAGADEHVVAYSPIAPVGWAIISEESWEMVANPTLRITQTAPLVLVPALLIAVVALWFGARQIVRPIQNLEARATKLAWGDFKAIEEPVGGIAEIRHLQAELVGMAHKLQIAQKNLHNYIGAITKGQEEERRRMARDLHDDTIQSLIALKQRLQLLEMASQNEPSIAAIAELEGLTEQAIENLRRLTRALRPIYLEDLGLVAALEMLGRETTQSSKLPVHFQRNGAERRLAPVVELALYRMAQEALSNIVRHAQASEASLSLTFETQSITLVVTDNGKGFDVPKSPSEFAPSGHFGLLGLHERAELIGATLDIHSGPGLGSRLSVCLPTA